MGVKQFLSQLLFLGVATFLLVTLPDYEKFHSTQVAAALLSTRSIATTFTAEQVVSIDSDSSSPKRSSTAKPMLASPVLKPVKDLFNFGIKTKETNYPLNSELSTGKKIILPQRSMYRRLPLGMHTVEGIFFQSHVHDFTAGTSENNFELVTDQGIIPVIIDSHLTDSLPESGSKVRFTGVSDAQIFQLKTPNAITVLAAPVRPSSRSGGSGKVSVVLYKFQNDPTPPISSEDVRKMIFEQNPDYALTTSDFMELSSYNNFSLEGKTSVQGTTDMYGWYTVAVDRPSCSNFGNQTRDHTFTSSVIAQAIQSGLQIGVDDLVIMATFPNGCSEGGDASYLPIDNNFNFNGAAFQQGLLAGLVRMNTVNNWFVVLHEISHLAGGVTRLAGHSSSVNCNDGSGGFSPYSYIADVGGRCTHTEYGSPFSVLGSPWASGAQRHRLLDSNNKIAAGFLTTLNYFTPTANGTFDIVKSNFSNAQILRIPLHFGKTYINNQIVKNDYYEYFSIEARDFLGFEQGTDTVPHSNILLVKKDATTVTSSGELLEVTSSEKKVNPGASFFIDGLGVIIENLGQTPSDPNKVRVKMFYQKPVPIEIPVTTFSAVKSPLYVKVQANGSLNQQQKVIIKNTSSSQKKILLVFPNMIDRVYPSFSQVPVAQLDTAITTWLNNRSPFTDLSLQAGQSYDFYPFNGLILTPADLVGFPRFIYKFTLVSGFSVNTPIAFIYLVHGQFTPAELVQYGILPQPTIQNSPQVVQPTGLSTVPSHQ